MLRFRRELRDEVGAAEDHLAILVARRERREEELARAEAGVTPPLARLTPQSRDSPRRDGRPNACAARSRGTHPAATDSATRYSPCRRASSTLRSPLVSRPDPSPPPRTEPSRAQLCHPPTRPSTPALAQNTMDEEARLAADAHSTTRARVESLEARVEDQRRRLRESFDETERLRADATVSSTRLAPAPPPDRLRQAHRHARRGLVRRGARVGWPKSGRERRGNSSRTSNDGKKTKTKTKTRRRAARRRRRRTTIRES